MDRESYKSLAQRLEHPGARIYIGDLDAGKPNGNTYLDLGGPCKLNIEENSDDTVSFHFESYDGTKGTLTVLKEAIDESTDLSDTSDNQ